MCLFIVPCCCFHCKHFMSVFPRGVVTVVTLACFAPHHKNTRKERKKERKKSRPLPKLSGYSWVCTVRIKATLVYITTSLEITRWVFSSPVPAPKSFTYIHSSNTESVWVLLSPVLQRNVRKPQTRRQTLKRSDLLQGLKAYQMVVASSSQKGMETFETAAVSDRNNPTCFAAVHALDGLTSASCCL